MNSTPINSIRFSRLEKKNDKYNIINISSDNQKIFLNLPKLECQYGITKYNNNGTEKYSLNISTTDDNSTFEFLDHLDDWITDNFLENKQWLEKLNLDFNSSKEQIQQCGNSIINRQPTAKPYINLKLIFDNQGNFFCDMFKWNNGHLIPLKNIEDIKSILYKKHRVTSKIIVSNVWIMENKYGITLKPKKIVFYEC